MTGAEASFTYRALTSDGVSQHGVIIAESAEAACQTLWAKGIYPVEVRESAAPPRRKRRIPAGDLAQGLRLLGNFLESGMPLSRALLVLEGLLPPTWRRALPDLRESIRRGDPLSAGLAATEIEIPPLATGIIRAGEAGGSVAAALVRAAELLESSAATRAALRKALTYPMMLAIAGSASTVLLVAVVLPRFAAILSDLGQDLPPTTAFLLGTATLARAGMLPVGIAMLALYSVWYSWVRTSSGERRWHSTLLRVPWLGSLRHATASARVAESLAALLNSGVPLGRALSHATAVAGDTEVQFRLNRAREGVIEGQGLSRALELNRAVVPTIVRLVKAGEETGDVPAMLEYSSRMTFTLVDERLRRSVAYVEPGMILIFGLIILLIATSLLQAIYAAQPAL